MLIPAIAFSASLLASAKPVVKPITTKPPSVLASAIPARRPCAASLDSLRTLDSLALDTLKRIVANRDSALRERDSLLTGNRDTIARLRTDSVAWRVRSSQDSSLTALLRDSLAMFHRIDSSAIRFEPVSVSDSDLVPASRYLHDLLVQAAVGTGYSIHQKPIVPGIWNATPLRIELKRNHDSAWVRLDLGGKVVHDSVRLRDSSSIPRMERQAIRAMFGQTSIPPEPKGPWHWAIRAGIVATTAIASLIVVLVLQ